MTLGINHEYMSVLLKGVYLYSVQFMCVFAHENLILIKNHVHFVMFTERSY